MKPRCQLLDSFSGRSGEKDGRQSQRRERTRGDDWRVRLARDERRKGFGADVIGRLRGLRATGLAWKQAGRDDAPVSVGEYCTKERLGVLQERAKPQFP